MNNQEFDIAQLVKQQIEKLDPAASIILYGSRARGEAKEESDWDFLILTDYDVDINVERQFRDIVYDIELETGAAISLFVYSKSEWKNKQKITPFYDNISKEGLRI